MISQDNETKIKKIVAEISGVGEEKIGPTSSFEQDLGMDSLDQVELMMAFEDHFEIDIPDEDAEKIRTYGDALNYMEKTHSM